MSAFDYCIARDFCSEARPCDECRAAELAGLRAEIVKLKMENARLRAKGDEMEKIFRQIFSPA